MQMMVFMLDPILISKKFRPFVPFVDKSPPRTKMGAVPKGHFKIPFQKLPLIINGLEIEKCK